MAETGGNKDDLNWSPPTSFEEYRLLWPLGRGGMGEVYLGHDTVLDRPVAIKFVMNLETDQQARERYLIEARAAARLQHPNVVTIYRVGEIEAHPYIIAEYIQGQDLQALPKPVPWQFALELATGLSRGLAAAHKRGVLHRDIKPANAILADNGEVKLLDFGLAKYVDKQDSVSVRWANQEVVAPTMEATASGHFAPVAGESMPPDLPSKIQIQGAPALSAQKLVPLPAAFPIVMQSDDQFRPIEFPRDQPPQTPLGYSRSSQIKGTPIYMAPERLLGAPATRRSDVYSMGALLYELLSGVPPHFDVPFEKLPQVVPDRDVPPLLHLAPSVDSQLAQVVDRCLKRNPADRYSSGEDLQTALELCLKGKHAAMLPEGNPYRGGLAYDSDHRALYLGRRTDCGALLDRLRSEAVLIVAGDAGSGKTSLVRAGLLPLVGEGAIGGGRRWRTISTQPGRHPMQSLGEAIAEAMGPRTDQADLLEQLRQDPTAVQRQLHKRTSDRRGLVLFIDQLEELLTHGTESEAREYLRCLTVLFERHAGLRLIVSVRSNFLGTLATLTSELLEWTRDIYFLKPLPKDKLREIIVEPALGKGVVFEGSALIEQLIEFASRGDGGLALLGIVLAELWDARTDNNIGEASRQAIGGIEGAIARHADHVIGSLSKERRTIARKILLSLLTPERTIRRRSEEELTVHGPEALRVLQVLLSGRLLTLTDTPQGASYGLAHPMLVKDWPTLTRWIEDQTPAQSSRSLVPVMKQAPPSLKERGLKLLWTILPTLILGLGLLGWDVTGRWLAKQKLRTQLAQIEQTMQEARGKHALVELYQKQALSALDGPRPQQADAQWEHAHSAAAEAERAYSRVSQSLELLLNQHKSVRLLQGKLAMVLYQRALLAELDHQDRLLDDLLKRLPLYDEDQQLIRRWQKPGSLTLSSQPDGATVAFQRYQLDAQGHWSVVENKVIGKTPVSEQTLPPGSYLITVSQPGHRDVRLPMLIGHDEELKQHVILP